MILKRYKPKLGSVGSAESQGDGGEVCHCGTQEEHSECQPGLFSDETNNCNFGHGTLQRNRSELPPGWSDHQDVPTWHLIQH